jgi:hypothetical protein
MTDRFDPNIPPAGPTDPSIEGAFTGVVAIVERPVLGKSNLVVNRAKPFEIEVQWHVGVPQLPLVCRDRTRQHHRWAERQVLSLPVDLRGADPLHATSTKVAGAVCDWAQHCLPTVAVVAYAGEVLIVLRLPTAYGPTAIARELLINAIWIVVALLARRLRPDRPIWLIMLAFAVLLTLIGPVGLGVQEQSWFTAVLVTVGIGLVPY